MDNIEQTAAKLGLDKGYYLLLMAILDESTDSDDRTLVN